MSEHELGKVDKRNYVTAGEWNTSEYSSRSPAAPGTDFLFSQGSQPSCNSELRVFRSEFRLRCCLSLATNREYHGWLLEAFFLWRATPFLAV